jgi:hypothetical protein
MAQNKKNMVALPEIIQEDLRTDLQSSIPDILRHDDEAIQRFQFFHKHGSKKPIAKLSNIEVRLLLITLEWAIDFQSTNGAFACQRRKEYASYKKLLWNNYENNPHLLLQVLGQLGIKFKTQLSGSNPGNLHSALNILIYQEGFFNVDAALKFIDKKCLEHPGDWQTYKCYRTDLELAYNEYADTKPADRIILPSANMAAFMILSDLAKTMKYECSLNSALTNEYSAYIKILQNRGNMRNDVLLHQLQQTAIQRKEKSCQGLLHEIIKSINLDKERQNRIPLLEIMYEMRIKMQVIHLQSSFLK